MKNNLKNKYFYGFSFTSEDVFVFALSVAQNSPRTILVDPQMEAVFFFLLVLGLVDSPAQVPGEIL